MYFTKNVSNTYLKQSLVIQILHRLFGEDIKWVQIKLTTLKFSERRILNIHPVYQTKCRGKLFRDLLHALLRYAAARLVRYFAAAVYLNSVKLSIFHDTAWRYCIFNFTVLASNFTVVFYSDRKKQQLRKHSCLV